MAIAHFTKPCLLLRLVETDKQKGEIRATRADLQESVAQELARLLNTRCARENTGALTVLDYGVPDYSGAHSFSEDDQRQIESDIVRAIKVFEPRMIDPRAKVEQNDAASNSLQVRLEGKLKQDVERWPVVFHVRFRPGVTEVQQEFGN